ncbi:MAG: hypothetical protein F6K19_34435 [Cyanothece sp. SIO1E1]|nr:hypothetical protein [Cyanothece sp. SIO1E1]
MSQSASTNQATLKSSSELTVATTPLVPEQPDMVDAYADDLMDELFEDVDRILDGSIKLPTESLPSEQSSLQSITVPRITLPSALTSGFSSVLSQREGELGALPAAADASREQRSKIGRGFDRLLLGAAGASLVLTLALWGVSQRGNRQVVVLEPEVKLTAEELQAQADGQFLEYLKRSLDVLDRRVEANQQASGGTAVAKLPPLPGRSVSSAAPASTVLERVYIPVYRPPQALGPTSLLPSLPNSTNSVTPTAPNRQTTANNSASVSSAAPLPTSRHVLVGVLELGDRSAALFDIDGSTQRFYVGETIGSSGWALVSVANQEAVIRRNGEVRSVYVGQQF